jgi:ABC-type sugar transport system permease subunit
VLAVGVLLRAIWYFNWFDLIWLLTGGGPGRATEVMPIIAYRTAFVEFQFGRASAVSDIMLMISLVLVLIYFRYKSKQDAAEAEA